MKWTKLEYGKWPEGEIVLRILDEGDQVQFVQGYIYHSELDNVWCFFNRTGPDMTIDSIYDIEPHYIILNDIPMPEAEHE